MRGMTVRTDELIRMSGYLRLRGRLYAEIEDVRPGRPLTAAQRMISVLILAAVMHAVLSTERNLVSAAPALFMAVDFAFGVIFLVEYVARMISVGEVERFRGVRGRFSWAIRPASMIDLAAIIPSLLLSGLAPAWMLRLRRVLRILRIIRIGPVARGYAVLADAVQDRRGELFAAAGVSGLLMLFAATGLHFMEGSAQPEAFGSIPRATWWAVATLTTVGYGDVYPVTAPGRIFAGFSAIAGIGVIAMPTGILSAAISDALERSRKGST